MSDQFEHDPAAGGGEGGFQDKDFDGEGHDGGLDRGL
jgi:hypothetical protein